MASVKKLLCMHRCVVSSMILGGANVPDHVRLEVSTIIERPILPSRSRIPRSRRLPSHAIHKSHGFQTTIRSRISIRRCRRRPSCPDSGPGSREQQEQMPTWLRTPKGKRKNFPRIRVSNSMLSPLLGTGASAHDISRSKSCCRRRRCCWSRILPPAQPSQGHAAALGSLQLATSATQIRLSSIDGSRLLI